MTSSHDANSYKRTRQNVKQQTRLHVWTLSYNEFYKRHISLSRNVLFTFFFLNKLLINLLVDLGKSCPKGTLTSVKGLNMIVIFSRFSIEDEKS